MRAFISGTVTKQQLLESLQRHRDRDAFHQGAFWNDDKQTGCGVGCSIHDFAPGAEADHSQYETLFGIPAELARLEDYFFETLSPADAAHWPIAFANSIPDSADLSTATPRWLLAVLTNDDSPLAHARHIPRVADTAAALSQWLETGTTDQDALHNLMNNPARPSNPANNLAVEAASLIARDLYLFRQSGPHTISDLNTLDMVVCQAARSYGYHAADEHPSEQAAHGAAVKTLANMLLAAISASPVTEADC